jgi:hypothetical protein
MPKKIYILNAPPQCGKDTIAQELSRSFGCYQGSFKEPLFQVVSEVIGYDFDKFITLYNRDNGWKDKPQFNGKSIRALMIHTSENYLKPFFGKDYFGVQLANDFKHNTTERDIVVVSDGGFEEEVLVLVKEFGYDKVEVLQISREGFTSFEGDSRNWINIDGVKTVKFDTTNGNGCVINYITGGNK